MPQVDLAKTNLTGQNLSLVENKARYKAGDFTYMRCANANFTGLDLAGANFTGADLTGAIFTDAILDGANFTNAFVWDTNEKEAKQVQVPLEHLHTAKSVVNLIGPEGVVNLVRKEPTPDPAALVAEIEKLKAELAAKETKVTVEESKEPEAKEPPKARKA